MVWQQSTATGAHAIGSLGTHGLKEPEQSEMEKEGKLKNVGLYEHKSAFYRIAVYLPLAVRKSAKVHITYHPSLFRYLPP